jgi:hypothetical protein
LLGREASNGIQVRTLIMEKTTLSMLPERELSSIREIHTGKERRFTFMLCRRKTQIGFCTTLPHLSTTLSYTPNLPRTTPNQQTSKFLEPETSQSPNFQ